MILLNLSGESRVFFRISGCFWILLDFYEMDGRCVMQRMAVQCVMREVQCSRTMPESVKPNFQLKVHQQPQTDDSRSLVTQKFI